MHFTKNYFILLTFNKVGITFILLTFNTNKVGITFILLTFNTNKVGITFILLTFNTNKVGITFDGIFFLEKYLFPWKPEHRILPPM